MSKNAHTIIISGIIKIVLCLPYIIFVAIYIQFLSKSKKKSFLNRDWDLLTEIGSFITLLALLLLALKELFFS